jgi:hypothetical protein
MLGAMIVAPFAGVAAESAILSLAQTGSRWGVGFSRIAGLTGEAPKLLRGEAL